MKLYHREKYLKKIRPFYHEEDIVKVITGLRRCGKSSLMATIREELIAGGVSQDDIVFLDLDKRGYRSIKTTDQLEKLIDSFPKGKGITYLFVDEIQNVRNFEELLNGYRTDGGYSIFITGSNSYLLSGEMVTKLTGRYIEWEIFTLSFDEVEEMKKFYDLPIKESVDEELEDYILNGAFPRALFLNGVEEKRTYVSSVVNEIIGKDVYKRGKVRNRESFLAFMNFLIGNFGSTISTNNIVERMKKEGLSLSKATARRYIELLKNAKIIYECPRFDLKSKKSLSNEKKYYLGDLGFYFALRTDNRINYGPVLENLVYLYAKGLNYSVSVGRIGKTEVDFLLRDTNRSYSYIQVTYTIFVDQSTEDREYRPLEAIKDNYPKYLLSLDKFTQQRNGILHYNLIKFMENQQKF